MSGEPAAPAPEPSAPAPATSELQPNAPAPADGGDANVDANAPAPEPQPSAESIEEQTKKQQRFNNRFSDLSRQVREEREARIRAEARAETLERLGIRPQQEQPAPAPVVDVAPNPADKSKYPGGEFDPRYTVDLAKYELRQEQKAEREQQAERERAQAANAAIEQGRQRLETTISAAVAEADGANGEHFQNAPRVLELAFVPVREGGLPRHVVDLITESENPVHIAEVLGRQPERLHGLRQVNPLQAAKQIGALDAQITANLKRIAAQPAPAPKPAPQPSPAPIPTAPAGGAAPQFNPENAPFSEFEAHFARVRGAGA